MAVNDALPIEPACAVTYIKVHIRLLLLLSDLLLRPGRDADYSDQPICLSVCLSVCP